MWAHDIAARRAALSTPRPAVQGTRHSLRQRTSPLAFFLRAQLAVTYSPVRDRRRRAWRWSPRVPAQADLNSPHRQRPASTRATLQSSINADSRPHRRRSRAGSTISRRAWRRCRARSTPSRRELARTQASLRARARAARRPARAPGPRPPVLAAQLVARYESAGAGPRQRPVQRPRLRRPARAVDDAAARSASRTRRSRTSSRRRQDGRARADRALRRSSRPSRQRQTARRADAARRGRPDQAARSSTARRATSARASRKSARLATLHDRAKSLQHAARARPRRAPPPRRRRRSASSGTVSAADDDRLVQAHGGAYGFFQAPGTNYRVGDEPKLAARLDALGKALHLHLIGLSGYRTPQHSVEVGGFANDPHTKGQASDTPGVEGVSEATLNQFGLTRPFGGAAEADHIQLDRQRSERRSSNSADG